MTINGSLLVSIPVVKRRFRSKIFQDPPKRVPEMAVFRENGGLNVKFYFQNPQKAHPCAEPRLLTSDGQKLTKKLITNSLIQ